jgi:hypothetical protein
MVLAVLTFPQVVTARALLGVSGQLDVVGPVWAGVKA